MMDLVCLTAMHDRTWHIFLPFLISVSPLYSVFVTDSERYILLSMVLPLHGICVFGVEGQLPMVWFSDRWCPWDSNEEYLMPIISVKLAILCLGMGIYSCTRFFLLSLGSVSRRL